MSPLRRLRAWWRGLIYAARVRLFGRLAVEAATEGGTALHAVALDSPEGDIQAATQRQAWTTQIGRLEAIDVRSRDQEFLLRQLRRNVRELDAAEAAHHATPQGLGSRRLWEFKPVGQQTRPSRFLGAVAGIQLWHALAIGWAVTFGLLGVQTALKERIENQRDDARADLAMVERRLEDARQIQTRLVEEVRAADLLSQQTAANLEAERARSRAAAAAERRRQRALREVDTGGGPPDWERSLRDDDAVAGQTGGSSGGAPTGNPG